MGKYDRPTICCPSRSAAAIERATAADSSFTVRPDSAPAVAEICHRLDGIPLALELAAARVGVLTVVQIGQRLDDRFRLLTSGVRTASARQQTLRATVEWSYDLLDDRERLVFERLCAFAGGGNLQAAEEQMVEAARNLSSWDLKKLGRQVLCNNEDCDYVRSEELVETPA